VKEYERKQLLERVNRDGATVGARIPERITVQGEPVDLREFVFEIKRRDAVPEGMREEVKAAKRNLRRERTARVDRLKEDQSLSREEGEQLVESVVGIDRALNALESLGSPDLETEVKASEAADQKRWNSFLRQVLGRSEGRGSGR